ncbi:MAG: hypothetical protein APG08_00722 [Candidatus Methanofastidiosum methylothiophilum]|jgi:micrococcal nuclease|uniref:TNase-like domain-containing protein n=1 Tax=Candidatus Methanofastidiosum methylothiophilum TaxID=1705564 RepID=A0A150J9Q6_9EURY|nr:MAG: hypothetical protein AN188_01400 [Candidatus Methanofastidiosum methylthiophilus]OQC51523.1 MAG: hypothetical protein BWX56_00940 [Euryarchaeota archaeon ADurb.Bin023]HNV93499.1 thermonuclease family protein [Methanofastidiosum sp.]KYC56765.1 MAG: hypothetical protein APG08_00722 [Candidatus Methanofastidiosum methylthiophilus]KYC57857.1 MAG: hypothetical protein APG09_00884 [Candidatus Methanofastidiosum methylthiophilus]
MKKILIVIFFILISICCVDPINLKYSPSNRINNVLVTKVIDGDTIEILVEENIEKVRLVGIDTPEPYSKNNESKWYNLPDKHLRKWGVNAFYYTNERLYNKEVNISYDTIQGQKDQFGRTLAYVYINNKNFNIELVKNGFARVYTEKKSDYYIILIKAETYARNNKIGLWNYSYQDN